MSLLRELADVKGCTLYGSLAEGRGDALSDIDIALDVSGVDTAVFYCGGRICNVSRSRTVPRWSAVN